MNILGINESFKIDITIKRMRITKGLTQKEVAKLLNISYSNYENDNREPNSGTIKEIAHILDSPII